MDLSEANRFPARDLRASDTFSQLFSISLLILFACFVILA